MAEAAGSDSSLWQGALAGIAARTRGNIVAMSRKAEEAVTAPHDPGAFPAQWRLAVAARIANLNGLADIAGHYLAGVSDQALRALAEPSAAGGPFPAYRTQRPVFDGDRGNRRDRRAWLG